MFRFKQITKTASRGFTLVEILVAVIIIGMLVAAATPIYEKTVEKSRLAEARTTLKKLYESKLRVMEYMEKNTYTANLFGFENLDFAMTCKAQTADTTSGHIIKCSSADWTYSLLPSGTGNANMLCAARRKGDNANMALLYKGDEVSGTSDKFFCNNSSGGSCEDFGLSSTGETAWCSAD